MVTLGDSVLYASVVSCAIALFGLLLKEFKKNDILMKYVSPMIFLTAGFLSFSYILITYYFVIGDYTVDYVYQYSSSALPLVYKISGVWAGQPGTYLMWVLVILLSAAWLAYTTKHSSSLSIRTQIITLIAGIYFIGLTLIQTPFKLIYEGRPDLLGYIPPDGSGLNALLVNFWMIVHPPLMFIGYGAITIPFAAALVYIITKDDGWEELSRQWARFTWLFLGLGIAVGGVWAYVVLGWGGFWAWDPVETASFIPWLALTGFLHAASLHRKNKAMFSISAPVLAILSFILVLYAALVVRSGIFNSVHSFGDTSTGTLLISAIIVTSVVLIALGMKRYLNEPDSIEEDWSLWSKKNIFYVSLLLFVVLAFISFWGITFPAFIQITQGIKVGVASDTKNFFNIWSYPFTILLLLALGFCLDYNEKDKAEKKKMLYIISALTFIAMFIRTENFYVLDHNSPFFVSEPFIYKMIGSISVVSIFPPMIYATFSIATRLKDYLEIKSLRPKLKGIGIIIIHFGVVFILFGAVISSNFTTNIDGINIPLSAKGQLVPISEDYSIKIVDISNRNLAEVKYPGTPIKNILESPSSFQNQIKISGKVTGSQPLEGHGTLVEITDTSGSMWVVFQQNLTLPENLELIITGELISGFEQPVLSVINVEEFGSGQYNVQSVKLEVYQKDTIIGSGVAEYLEGKGSGTFPMVSTSITGTDVYVIFQGIGGGVIPLTLKIIPAINFTWLGIILFGIGIILIMSVKIKKD